jgi:hypothetical protein
MYILQPHNKRPLIYSVYYFIRLKKKLYYLERKGNTGLSSSCGHEASRYKRQMRFLQEFHLIGYLHILEQGEYAVPTPRSLTAVAQYGKYGLPRVVHDFTAASVV